VGIFLNRILVKISATVYPQVIIIYCNPFKNLTDRPRWMGDGIEPSWKGPNPKPPSNSMPGYFYSFIYFSASADTTDLTRN